MADDDAIREVEAEVLLVVVEADRDNVDIAERGVTRLVGGWTRSLLLLLAAFLLVAGSILALSRGNRRPPLEVDIVAELEVVIRRIVR